MTQSSVFIFSLAICGSPYAYTPKVVPEFYHFWVVNFTKIWNRKFTDYTDAIMDRFVANNAGEIELKGESLRQKKRK